MNDISKDSGEAALQSAEPAQQEYAPVLRVLIAVAYMGVLAGVMGLAACAFAAAAGRKSNEQVALSVAALVISLIAAAVLTVIDKKKLREFEKRESEALENAARYSGRVVSVEKHVRSIIYANSRFEEITWNFVIEYEDEDGKTITVKSGRYSNDISAVLSDVNVEVLRKPDGTFVFGKFNTDGSVKITLPVNVTEEE